MTIDVATLGFFSAFARCAGCLMLLPGFASARTPMQVRVLLLLALASAVVPFAGHQSILGQSIHPLKLVSLMASETFIGAMLAASSRMFLLSVGFFATAISSAIGMSGQLGTSIVDADAEPALATLYTMTALLIMFALDFHHLVIAALAASYDIIPVGGKIEASVSAREFFQILSEGFSNVFRLASPFLAFALLANLYIALVNKLAPNLQLYFVAAPAVIVGGLFLALSLVAVLQPISLEMISQMQRLR